MLLFFTMNRKAPGAKKAPAKPQGERPCDSFFNFFSPGGHTDLEDDVHYQFRATI